MSKKLKFLSALLAIGLLSACATQDPKRVVDAATSPLSDLNLVRAEIPSVLQTAQNKPYGMPADLSCPALNTEVLALDVALGPDLDATATGESPDLVMQGVSKVKDSAIGSIQSVTNNVIPFRDWVRKLTGAEAYASKVTASVHAGVARRAFLKGIKASRECV